MDIRSRETSHGFPIFPLVYRTKIKYFQMFSISKNRNDDVTPVPDKSWQGQKSNSNSST